MKRISLCLILAAMITLPACDVLNQAQKMANLAKCDFSLKTVEGLTLAGVNVQQINNMNSLNMLDAAMLTAALASGSLLLSFTLNVGAKNPNASPAGMNRLEWILYIDDIEMTKGTLNKPVTIPPNNGVATFPLQMNVDLKKVLTGQSADAILNFGMNLAGAGNRPTRFLLKAKPTISVGGYSLDYPGYLNIRASW